MGLLGDVARTALVAGTWTAVSNRISRHQAGRWAAEDQAKQPAYMPPPPGRYQRPMFQTQYQQPPPQGDAPAPPSPNPMTKRLGQLQQLANLKSQGVLTDEEFQAQKRALLRS